jgi:hypothetical protein
MLPILSFIQRIGINKAILEAIGLKEGKSSKKQTNLIMLCILAIIDGATRIQQIPHFMQKNYFIKATTKSAKFFRIRYGIEPVALLTTDVCALMDSADRVKQIQ